MINVPKCLRCVHLDKESIPTKTLTCPAFPESIPRAILENDFDHVKPYPGDHGIRFEAFPETK